MSTGKEQMNTLHEGASDEMKKVQTKETLILMYKDLVQVASNFSAAAETMEKGGYEGSDFIRGLGKKVEAIQAELAEGL